MFLLTLLACRPDAGPSPRGVPPEPIAPGHAGNRTLQRLNRSQFQRTLRDLTGLDRDFAAGMPPDESAFGFDNLGAALSLSVGHLEAIEAVVDELATELLSEKDEATRTWEVQGEGPGVSYSGDGTVFGGTSYLLFDGTLSATLPLEGDGEFQLVVVAAGEEASGAPVLEIEVDGAVVATEELLDRSFRDVVVDLDLEEGLHVVTLRIANPSAAGASPRRTVGIDRLMLTGPMRPEVGRTPVWRKLVPCAPDGDPSPACQEQVFRDFGLRAWRRPLTDDDLAWVRALADATYAAGGTADESLVAGLRGLLLAPEFLFRVEALPEAGESERALDGYEVGARLAAFLWSSTPDDELLAAAADGSLLRDDGLDAQVERMLDDPRARSLVDDLAGQWFDLRDVALVAPDAVMFPSFDEALRDSMREELALLSEAWLLGDRDLRWVVETDETWIDERLAEHYRVPFGAGDTGFVPVYTGRIGITGTAGFLTTHARPARASAVSRGKWVLENLLCDAPPPPPPTVNMMMNFEPVEGSVREQEETLRGEGSCQACHASMDAVGFSLGGFDAVGAARSTDELGWPVDTAVVLDGIALADQADLAAYVANDPRLPRCAVEQTLTFAVGRPVDDADDPVIDALTEAFVADGSTFEALAKVVVRSAPFRRRSLEERP
jgi:hypothetical protein